MRKTLLVCGIVSSLLYVAMLVLIPLQWDGYSSGAQTGSDLSAIDAPTRTLWVPLGIIYTLLVAPSDGHLDVSSWPARPAPDISI